MLLLKYAKRGNAVYLSHLDVLRHLNRGFRRAGIEVAPSLGYHPHPQIFMANPLAIGVTSLCEYVVIVTDCAADDALARYNAVCHDGLPGLSCVAVSRNPNVAALGIAGRYEAPVRADPAAVAAFFAQTPIVLRYRRNGKDVVADLTDRFFGYSYRDGTLAVTLGCGALNVRPDKLAERLAADLGLEAVPDFVKTELFGRENGKLCPLDALIRTHDTEGSHA